jgi:vacuolar-type H+-ATPase subunit E/Vma4
VGADALRAAIEAEGSARIAAILRGAELEASLLRREASSKARQRQSDELRDLEAQLRHEANARIAEARAEARKQVLDAREAFIRRVFDGAREAVSSEAEASALHAAWIARAERALDHMPPDGPIVFTCSSAVAPLLEPALVGREGVRVESDPELPAGFRATGPNGAVVVDATFPSLLEMDRPLLAIEVLRRLRGEQSERGGGA